MAFRRSSSLFRHNLLLLAADPAPILVTVLMPLVLMAFLQGTGAAVLQAEGFADANGSEQVVPMTFVDLLEADRLAGNRHDHPQEGRV